MRELVAYCPGARLERFAALNGFHEALAARKKSYVPALVGHQPMGEQAQRLDRADVCVTLPQGFAQCLAALIVEVEEHVLLAGEMIEHRHPPHVGGLGDLVHCHGVETALEEQAGRRVRYALTGRQPLAGPSVRRCMRRALLNHIPSIYKDRI